MVLLLGIMGCLISTNKNSNLHFDRIIKDTFKPFATSPLPEKLVPDLLARFSSSEGYRLYPDVMPLFDAIRESKRSQTNFPSPWPWDLTVVGVVTNSDDRVPSILSSLGLNVGPRLISGSSEKASRTNTNDDVSFTVLSYDVGMEKPDVSMFDAASALLRATLFDRGHPTSPNNSKDEASVLDGFTFLHIGDDVKKDVVGAKEAGWNSLLLDRDGHYAQYFRNGEDISEQPVTLDVGDGDSDIQSVHVIRDLRALQSWIPFRS
ncbi:MAG: hypothetical protein M1833_004909 [Piccolia ochrophora]|nr:MAG: hypothetical protein M1833_004909 [Piccolia ochrophora]